MVEQFGDGSEESGPCCKSGAVIAHRHGAEPAQAG
jgi:hypothetical protein